MVISPYLGNSLRRERDKGIRMQSKSGRSVIRRLSLENGSLDLFEESYACAGESDLHCRVETELVLLQEGIIDDVRKGQAVRRMPGMLILMPAEEVHAPHVHGGVRLFQIRIQPS